MEKYAPLIILAFPVAVVIAVMHFGAPEQVAQREFNAEITRYKVEEMKRQLHIEQDIKNGKTYCLDYPEAIICR